MIIIKSSNEKYIKPMPIIINFVINYFISMQQTYSNLTQTVYVIFKAAIPQASVFVVSSNLFSLIDEGMRQLRITTKSIACSNDDYKSFVS